jgi:polar amino acid transport system substrate-binding protein
MKALITTMLVGVLTIMTPAVGANERRVNRIGPTIPSEVVIYIADDSAEWPPYLYYERIDGRKTNKVAGFSLDVIRLIFGQAGIEFDVRLLPWKRALKAVEDGEQYQMILNSSYVKERERFFFYSLPYYTIKHVAFYSAIHHPQGLTIQDINDIKSNYKVCGLRGYSYTSVGLNNRAINLNFSSYEQLIEVLHERPQMCDLFVEGYEALKGFKAVGSNYFSGGDLKHSEIPGITANGFRMLISKNFDHGEALKIIINNGITALGKSGELKSLLDKYQLAN